jgi:hypothetical protein
VGRDGRINVAAASNAGAAAVTEDLERGASVFCDLVGPGVNGLPPHPSKTMAEAANKAANLMRITFPKLWLTVGLKLLLHAVSFSDIHHISPLV